MRDEIETITWRDTKHSEEVKELRKHLNKTLGYEKNKHEWCYAGRYVYNLLLRGAACSATMEFRLKVSFVFTWCEAII